MDPTHAAITGVRKRDGTEKALGAVKVIKDQIQYRSQSLPNLARGFFKSQKVSLAYCKLFWHSNLKTCRETGGGGGEQCTPTSLNRVKIQ